MARLYRPPHELTGDTITISGDEHRHLVRVLRLGAGDRLVLFDGAGHEVEATVLHAGPRDAVLALGQRRRAAPRTAPPVTLLLGLSRGERMDLVIQKATELGIERVVPVLAARSTAGLRPRIDRWTKIAREAARQCGRADLPEIHDALALAPALAVLPVTVTARIVLWEEAAATALPLRAALAAPAAGVALLVGPEGGLTADEVAAAQAAGFQLATLGPRILRAETAAIAAVAIVQSLVGALD